MNARKNPAAITLGEQLGAAMQAGLEAHASLESELGASGVRGMAEAVGLQPSALSLEVFAGLLIGYLVYGEQPLTQHQTTLQQRTVDGIKNASARLVYRQLQHEQLRAWRYTRHSASRDTAQQVGGPEAHREELFDGCLLVSTGNELGSGRYLGWPVSTGDQHWLVAIAELSDSAAEQIKDLVPFPQIPDATTFWAEHLSQVLAIAADPHSECRRRAADDDQIPPGQFRDGAKITISPVTSPAELLGRVVQCADFEFTRVRSSWLHQRLRRERWVREVIAVARETDPLDALCEAFCRQRWALLGWSSQRTFKDYGDPGLETYLPLERMLAGFGLKPDRSMANTDVSTLRNHPLGILLLDDDHPIHLDLHPREAVRVGLEWGNSHDDDQIEAAFEAYRTERRWSMTYSTIDLTRDDHLARLDYADIVHALQAGPFDRRVAQTPLSELSVEPRHINRIEAALRPRPWTDENVLTVSDLPPDEPALLRLRNVGEGALLQLKQTLVELADGWRARRMGIDARELTARQTGAGASQSDLDDGLSALADLFGDLT